MNKKQKVWGIAKTILAIVGDVGEITAKSFFVHPYSHLFCNHKTTRSNFYSSFSHLKKRGLIKKYSDTFRPTKAGEKEAFFANLDARAAMHKHQSQIEDVNRILKIREGQPKKEYYIVRKSS